MGPAGDRTLRDRASGPSSFFYPTLLRCHAAAAQHMEGWEWSIRIHLRTNESHAGPVTSLIHTRFLFVRTDPTLLPRSSSVTEPDGSAYGPAK